jgi:hypothetical protein
MKNLILAFLIIFSACKKDTQTAPPIITPPILIYKDSCERYVKWIECTWYNSLNGLRSVIDIYNTNNVQSISIQTLYPTKNYPQPLLIGKYTLTLLSGYTPGNENWHRLRVLKKDGTEFLGTPIKPIQK